MILLSNVIKFTKFEKDEKRLLSTKPIKLEYDPAKEEEYDAELQEVDLEQERTALLQEIEQLHQRVEELHAQIEQDKVEAEHELQAWWEAKQPELEQEALSRYEEASQQGFEEGYEKGYRQVMVDFQEKQQELQEIISKGYEEQKRLIDEAEPFLLALSTKIAEKIVKQELKLHPEQILPIVKDGLQNVRERGEVLIQVSAENYALLLPHIPELQLLVDPAAVLKVIPDYSFAGEGCMIHTSFGTYDVTLDSQLTEIKKHLMNLYEESAHS